MGTEDHHSKVQKMLNPRKRVLLNSCVLCNLVLIVYVKIGKIVKSCEAMIDIGSFVSVFKRFHG